MPAAGLGRPAQLLLLSVATDASSEGREQLLPPEARSRAASLGGLLATVGNRGNAYSQLADDAPFKGT